MTYRVFILFFIILTLSCSDKKYEYSFHHKDFGDIAFCLKDQANSAIISDKVEVTINDSISVILRTNEDGESRHALRLKKGKYKLSFGVQGYQPLVTHYVEIKDGRTSFLNTIKLTAEK